MPDLEPTSSPAPSRPLALVALALAAPAWAAPRVGAAASAPDAEEDIAFARGLASKWQFVDLAEDVLLRVEKDVSGPREEEQLALAKCDIYAEGARTEGQPDRRLELYEKAVVAYQDFLDEHELGEYGAQAERSYVDICNAYGVTLADALEDAVGEEAEKMRARINDVLSDAVTRTNELVEGMQSSTLTERERRDLYLLMYNRGQLLLTLGKTAEEGAYFFNQAERTLEDLAFSAGETTPFGLHAYLLMGEMFAEQGRWRDSSDYYEFVVNEAIPRNPDLWEQIKAQQTRDQLQTRWQFVELGAGGYVQALAAQDKRERAADEALRYYNTWSREGFNLTAPHGYLSMLDVARALLGSGGFVGGRPGEYQWFETNEEMEAAGFTRRNMKQTAQGLAVAIADLVNRENRGNTLQVRAQKLISEITSSPGVQVPPEVLFEAAQGEYNARNYGEAVEAYKRVLAAIDREDEATQRLFAPKVYNSLGKCYDRLDRPFEAAMVYREGATRWQGDPEYDPQNARGFERAVTVLRRVTSGDDQIEALRRQAENLVVELGSERDSADILFTQALRIYSDRDYQAARAAFQEVPGNANSYEKAVTYAAVCAYKAGDWQTAKQELEQYLGPYLNDPTNNTTSERRLQARREAKAQATYYLGEIAFRRAEDNARAVELLGSYDKEFPNQDSYGSAALYIVVNAQLEARDFDGAIATHSRMLEKFPQSKQTGPASLQIYKVLADEREALEKAGKTEEARDVLRKMAENLQVSNRLDATPAFANLRKESLHWYDLGEWETARKVLQRIVDLYDRGSFEDATEEDMVRFVYPDLGHALLELGNVNDALAVLEPLVPDPDDEDDDRKPAEQTVVDYCRAVTGWVTGDESEFLEVPGVGGADRIEVAASWLNKISNSTTKWTCEWYGVKFDLAYAYYKWSQEDSAKRASAMRQIKTLRTELGPDLKGGDGVPGMHETCGDDVLRRRYLTLWDRVQ